MRNKRATKNSSRKARLPSVANLVRNAMLQMQEHKALSVQASGVIISSTGTVINLTNSIVEGVDINQRSGTTIRIFRMHFRFAMQMNTDDQSGRFIIFRDNMNTGTTPTVTDILPTTGYLSHFSDTREVQQKRYTIILDRISDVSIGGPSRITKVADIKYVGNVYYNAATAVAAANGKGALFLLVIGSRSTGLYDYDWQCEFTDS